MKKKQREITINDLAISIKDLATVTEKGFADVEKKTDGKMENLATVMKQGFEKAEKRTDSKIENLATVMKQGFANAEKKTDGKIEDLAMMIQGEFSASNQKLDKIEKETREGFAITNNKLEAFRKEILSINFKLDNLEERVAYYPDLRIEVADMQKEIKRIKTKVGLSS